MKNFLRPGPLLLLCAAVFVLIQFVPYGRGHANPPATAEPHWDSPATAALVHRACDDCHSNKTVWPWYSHVAPVSWLVQSDVDSGRRHLNFSRWDVPQKHAADVVKEVQSGDMPPWYFLPMHPEARLSANEKAQLIAGAAKSLGPQKLH